MRITSGSASRSPRHRPTSSEAPHFLHHPCRSRAGRPGRLTGGPRSPDWTPERAGEGQFRRLPYSRKGDARELEADTASPAAGGLAEEQPVTSNVTATAPGAGAEAAGTGGGARTAN